MHDTYVSQNRLELLDFTKRDKAWATCRWWDPLWQTCPYYKGDNTASMSFLHNIWAFLIRRKLGRGRYVSSYIIYYSKNELAFNEDLFVHILLIHAAHFAAGIAVSFRVQCCVFHPLFLSPPSTPQRTYSHLFQALGPVMCKLLAPSTPSVKWFQCHIPKKMAKSHWPFW